MSHFVSEKQPSNTSCQGRVVPLEMVNSSNPPAIAPPSRCSQGRKLFPGSARKTRQARLLAHLTAGNTGKNIVKRGANAGDQPNCFCFENKIWHNLAESVVILFFEEWIWWDFGIWLRNLEARPWPIFNLNRTHSAFWWIWLTNKHQVWGCLTFFSLPTCIGWPTKAEPNQRYPWTIKQNYACNLPSGKHTKNYGK